jgi:ATP-binding cassette subfamily B protein RaxB
MLNFSTRDQLPVIVQTEAAECGLACLAMIASYHGHRVDLNTLRRRHPVSLKGATLRALIQMATHLNLACRPLRFELDHLSQLRLPAIVHWDMNHFVVLKAVTKKTIVVHDPAFGEKQFPIPEASKHLTGVALEGLFTQGREGAASIRRLLGADARERTRDRADLGPLGGSCAARDRHPILLAARRGRGHRQG